MQTDRLTSNTTSQVLPQAGQQTTDVPPPAIIDKLIQHTRWIESLYLQDEWRLGQQTDRFNYGVRFDNYLRSPAATS